MNKRQGTDVAFWARKKWERRRMSLPRKFSLRAQRGNEVSHKVLLLSFLSRKESGSDAERHSHKKSPLRAQKGNKVSRKVLCQAFFQEKKVGATQNVTPTKNLRYGRRGETKFPTKFFAKLSFKKASEPYGQIPDAPGASGGSSPGRRTPEAGLPAARCPGYSRPAAHQSPR